MTLRGSRTIGRNPETRPLYPTSSSFDAPCATLVISWTASDRLSTQRECCSDDRGKHAVGGQFAGASAVGRAKIELGRSRMLVEDVLKLSEGAVVELDKLAGDPVDVFVNDRLVARGEVLVLNDNFCVRVNEIVAGVKEEGL